MTNDQPFEGLDPWGDAGEFSEEMKEVYGRLIRNAVTLRSRMKELVAHDPVGRHFSDATSDAVVEMLVREARQRDEPET